MQNQMATKDPLKTPPAKQSRFDESSMVALMYVESIPQASYQEWMAEKSKKLSPIKPAASLKDMDTFTKKRHDIAYICDNLMSWSSRVSRESCPITLPTFQEVQAAEGGNVPLPIDYDRDGLTWRSDIRICLLVDNKDVLWKNFVVHLPNDGFFYVDEGLLPVLATDERNSRHMKSCSEGWAYLDQCLWPKLAPFEIFARQWFGYNDDDNKKLQRQILYNDVKNRMDICLRCPATKVGIDFSFEPGYPVPEVPEEFWFWATSYYGNDVGS